jgi:hypothetical protein
MPPRRRLAHATPAASTVSSMSWCADPFRPHSAPAAAESVPAADSLSADADDLDVFSSVNQGAEMFRRDPEYRTFYHSHRAINPRMPPPLAPVRSGGVGIEPLDAAAEDAAPDTGVPLSRGSGCVSPRVSRTMPLPCAAVCPRAGLALPHRRGARCAYMCRVSSSRASLQHRCADRGAASALTAPVSLLSSYRESVAVSTLVSLSSAPSLVAVQRHRRCRCPQDCFGPHSGGFPPHRLASLRIPCAACACGLLASLSCALSSRPSVV